MTNEDAASIADRSCDHFGIFALRLKLLRRKQVTHFDRFFRRIDDDRGSVASV
ncbi:MAG: hypothetical protein ACI87E_003979 [Mariniblastus sp.]|jgi:hypothetical protein